MRRVTMRALGMAVAVVATWGALGVPSAVAVTGAAVAAGTAARTATLVASAAPSPVDGGWSAARQLPGFARLGVRGGGAYAASCPSVGNCVVAGSYVDSGDRTQAFEDTESSGIWGTAQEIPGTARLNADAGPGEGGGATSVSCPAVGTCALAGYYSDASGHYQGWVADEVGGHWTTQEIPSLGLFNLGGDVIINQVSCGAPGYCAVGGAFLDESGHYQAFLATEQDFSWGSAQQVASSLNFSDASVDSVDCPVAGYCTAGGYYTDPAGAAQSFVMDQVSGKWGPAAQLAGSATTGVNVASGVQAVSCSSAGNCSAVGSYGAGATPVAYTADEVNGSWGPARLVTGLAAHSRGGQSKLSYVSCVAGYCSAAGFYQAGSSGKYFGFEADKVGGSWQSARPIPVAAPLVAAMGSQTYAVSCAAPGNCAVGGTGGDVHGAQALIEDEQTSTRDTATEVPGSAALNKGGNAVIYALSCPAPGNCAATGYYTPAVGKPSVPFIASQG